MRWFGWMVMAAIWAQGDRTVARKATDAMAASVMAAWPKGVVATTKNPGSWGYEEGVLLDGLAADWNVDHDLAKLAYIQAAVNKYVKADGTIQMNTSGKAFTSDEHQLDNIELGRAVLFVYRQTKEARYAEAAKFLYEQLAMQPRTPSGGYWHKTIYPNQMWLDGAYMAEPFRAEYASTFDVPGDFDDIAKQLLLMYEHMRDARTGLLRHGWDESQQMPWANKTTGLSPEVWGRAVGWYCMALVDVLDWFPEGNRQRAKVVDAFTKIMGWVMQYQDETGLWWQVMDKRPRKAVVAQSPARLHTTEHRAEEGNYAEASASCMFTYAVAKGVRKGYLSKQAEPSADRGWAGIQKQFVKVSSETAVTLTGTVKAAGLGGTPYRPGTFKYYVGEKTGDDDAKGVGAYLLAGSEMEQVR